ncbi:MAG: pantoate--beta-alanine ligase [Bacteroidota bacterium]|nr:pantoate--beta-alanine ligase [Bacteroidota bacterium]
MEIIYNPGFLVECIDKLTQDGSAKLGFVPTMGALHSGHLSLVRMARQENDICVVSVFVNPTQFNDKNDFKTYPRFVDNDLKMLQDEGVDVVFIPHENDIYPTHNLYKLDLGGMDKTMEGKFRPGHFDGVADVVYRLFNIVKPDRAYFGNKDFQQLKVIETMVENENLDVEIIGCPIVREPDGLAMSSRNQRLNRKERKEAASIYTILQQAADVYASFTPDQLKSKIERQLNNTNLLKCEYVEIVQEGDLKFVRKWKNGCKMRICVAVLCGNVRLIDNYKIVT